MQALTRVGERVLKEQRPKQGNARAGIEIGQSKWAIEMGDRNG